MEDLTVYEFELKGKIPVEYLEWFGNFEILANEKLNGSHNLAMRGRVIDQAALRGLINKLFDLNFEIISIKQIKYDGEGEGYDG